MRKILKSCAMKIVTKAMAKLNPAEPSLAMMEALQEISHDHTNVKYNGCSVCIYYTKYIERLS